MTWLNIIITHALTHQKRCPHRVTTGWEAGPMHTGHSKAAARGGAASVMLLRRWMLDALR